jgi:TATA-box binding protein (TBP) (component of TFIID and TFIIIB)
MDWSQFEFTDYVNIDKNEIKDLPHGVKISTMCGKVKLNTTLLLSNIYTYFELNSKDILTLKINDDKIKTLIPSKKKKRKEKKNVTKFYNQITIVLRIDENDYTDLNDEKKLNFKIFNNGSIQISGVKKVSDVNRAINKLVHFLSTELTIQENGEEKTIQFIEEPVKVSDFSIYMINTNFGIKYHIDRTKLYDLLSMKNYKVVYERCIRACVNVKFRPEKCNEDGFEPSIDIFQKGNIRIAGARNMTHIIESYHFIVNELYQNIEEIYKKTEEEETIELFSLYEAVLKEYSHKLKKNTIQYSN